MSNKLNLLSIILNRIILIIQAVWFVLGKLFSQAGHKTRLFKATMNTPNKNTLFSCLWFYIFENIEL